MTRTEDIRQNLRQVKQQIAEAAARAGRRPEEVRLVCVTKTALVEEARALYDLGERDFGENRLKGLEEKSAALPQDMIWHFIGPLQRNKVRKVLEAGRVIHSVDSLALAAKIDQVSAEKGIRPECYLEVNSGEAQKRGFAPEALLRELEPLSRLSHVRFAGLMTMAPLTRDETVLRNAFSRLRGLRDEINIRKAFADPLTGLSMGMTNDFPIAVEEGSTVLRLGTALFTPGRT